MIIMEAGGVGGTGGVGRGSKVLLLVLGKPAPSSPFFSGTRLILSEAEGWAASAVLGGCAWAVLANFCFSSVLSAW